MFPLTDGMSSALFAWPRVRDDANVFGPLSVAVPGSVAGLTDALARWGTMELRDVLAPAIALAREGFVPDWYLALTTAKYVEELGDFPESARTYLRNGRSIYRPATAEYADRAAYPDLARSLELIARDGADAFYRGAIADALVAHMKETGGLITKSDLAAYRVRMGRAPDGRLPRTGRGVVSGRDRRRQRAGDPEHPRPVSPCPRGLAHAGGTPPPGPGDPPGFPRPLRAPRRSRDGRAPWEHFASVAYARAIASGSGAIEGGGRAPGEASKGPRCHSRRGAVARGPAPPKYRRLHDTGLRGGSRPEHGGADPHGGVDLRLAHGRARHGDSPQQRDDLVRSRARQAELGGAGQAGDGEHGAGPRVQGGRPYLAVGAPGGRRIISADPQVIANLADGARSAQAAIEAPRVHTEGEALEVDTGWASARCAS